MTAVLTLPITAPPLPNSYSPPSVSITRHLSAPHPTGHRVLLPVGAAHLDHLRLALHHAHDFNSFDAQKEAEIEGMKLSMYENGIEDDLGVGDESEPEDLLSLDPKEWKKQDHYAVLGLSKFRYLSTAEQIKIAHRKKVLKHHPDKKAQKKSNDDAFFKCIQKAHEVLTNAERRRQFDSVDPAFLEEEESISVSEKEFKAKKLDFFKTFSHIFELYSRFSRTQPVPLLGKLDASKDDVEGFYDFWYNFDSWRSFEWYDKEINEGSDNRDDKRYTEKKNKSERARRKKEDTTKLRMLVDTALGLDPRIKLIKEQEKAAREAKKGKPMKKTKAQEEEEKRREEEEAKKRGEEEKAAKAEAKKQKAAAANAAKKARRVARAADEGTAAAE